MPKKKVKRKSHNFGNDSAVKFKTPASRQKLCADFVAHIKKGFSKESFVPCDPQTFAKYVRLYPSDFDTIKIEEAFRSSRLYWEDMGNRGSAGKIKGFQCVAWLFNMKNRFPANWRDKHIVESTDDDRSKNKFKQYSDQELDEKYNSL